MVVGILVAGCRNALKISAPYPEKEFMSPIFSRLFYESDEKAADSKCSNGIQLNDRKDKQPAV